MRIKSGANFLIDLAKLSSTSISLACIVPLRVRFERRVCCSVLCFFSFSIEFSSFLQSDFILISATTLGVCTNSVSIQVC